MIQILRFNPENDSWKTLEYCSAYDKADERHEYWSNRYPNAWIEIDDLSECNE